MRRLLAILRLLDEVAEFLVFRVLLRPRWRWTVVTALAAMVLVLWAVTPARHAAMMGVPEYTHSAPAVVTDASPAEDPVALLRERPWIDALPRGEKDPLNLYFFGRQRFKNGEVGAFVCGNALKWTTELFAYRLDRGQVGFVFPANDEQARSTWVVRQERRGDFDLVLELGNDARRGKTRQVYYSSTDWDGVTIESAPMAAAIAAVQLLGEPR